MVDAVVMPVAPSASVKPGEGRYFGYTGVGNVLDLSAVTVPVGWVDKNVDVKNSEQQGYEAKGDMDREIWESCECRKFFCLHRADCCSITVFV